MWVELQREPVNPPPVKKTWLWEMGVFEKKGRAARRNAEALVAYKVNTSSLMDDKNGAHTQVEICNVSFQDFDIALAYWATDLDQSRIYFLKNYHKKSGEYLRIFAGDTGGRYFKFGFIIYIYIYNTPNQGKQSDKFQNFLHGQKVLRKLV